MAEKCEKTNSFKYMLRFTIQPGFHEEERLEKLISFCKKALIDDVIFFISCEELNTGHVTFEEATPWLDLIARAKQVLENEDITVSINPWTTLVHADRGRILKEGQNFQLMVDPYGKKASVQACPLCKEWRKYITGIYTLYTTLKPNIIWVEDDFRFHNHAPLTWGGCFCDIHMEEYSRQAGRKLSREEFFKGILEPGEPNPLRKIWLDTCRDTISELAETIGKAVHNISPSTKVGLMSSIPHVHCAEGRDWDSLLKGLAGQNPIVIRPHLLPYCETAPADFQWEFNTVTRTTCSIVPEDTEIYPELDNGPFSRFSKSTAFTRLQLESSICLGAGGITLSLFDMIGSGVIFSEGYQDMLSESKNFLNRLKALGLKRELQHGVKILFNTQSSYSIQTSSGESMQELYPREMFWASLLSAYGIPNLPTMEKEHKNEVIAVSGQYFRSMDRLEVENLFADNFVLLDGEAAYTLFDMKLGHLAGIKKVSWHGRESGFQTYEEICNGMAYCGIWEARLTSQAHCGDYAEIEYITPPSIIAVQKNPYGKTVGIGQAIFDNRVYIFPYGRFHGSIKAHLNPVQQEIMQGVLKSCLQPSYIAFVVNSPFVFLCLYKVGEKSIILLSNFSSDYYQEILIYAPYLKATEIIEISRSDEKPVRNSVTRDREYILLKTGLAGMDSKALICR